LLFGVIGDEVSESRDRGRAIRSVVHGEEFAKNGAVTPQSRRGCAEEADGDSQKQESGSMYEGRSNKTAHQILLGQWTGHVGIDTTGNRVPALGIAFSLNLSNTLRRSQDGRIPGILIGNDITN